MTEISDIETFVLDDDMDMQTLLRHIIGKEGLQNIFLFTRIRDLKEKLNPNVRVLVIDIRLEEAEDGSEAMKYVRKENPGCYVIAISGHVTDNIFIDLINNKVDWFIKKTNNYLPELVDQIKIGIASVAVRDAIMSHVIKSNTRIDRKNDEQRRD